MKKRKDKQKMINAFIYVRAEIFKKTEREIFEKIKF